MRLPVVPGGIRAKAWPPVLATRGRGSRSELHAHHAMHFILAVEGDIGVRTSDNGRWSRAAGVLTAPDIIHAVDADSVEVVLIFMDPESDYGAMFPARVPGPNALDRLCRASGADAWRRPFGVCATWGRRMDPKRCQNPRPYAAQRSSPDPPARTQGSLAAAGRAV